MNAKFQKISMPPLLKRHCSLENRLFIQLR
jgi:hypothetical protein